MAKKPLALFILDGFGNNPSDYGNAVKAARTPNLDRLLAECPRTNIGASGMDVGLPDGQMGNSEVGHTNIGAGRVVYQELTRITKAIADGDFFQNPALLGAVENCRQKGSALHLMGLLSNGGVHSHQEHLYGILQLCKRHGLSKVYVHCFMDGRDVPPTSGAGFIHELEQTMRALGVGNIATVMGRYYAMDRDNRWERVEKAYTAMVHGEGMAAADAEQAVKASYAEGKTDEFILPIVCAHGANIQADDSAVFFNFRPDRAREITRALTAPSFDGFTRRGGCLPLYFVCMTQYDATFTEVHVAYAPQSLENTFGAYIAAHGLKQLRIAETEKYAHVTFFFNGGTETPYKEEDRALIPSPQVATYDLKPEMSAPEVTEELMKRLESGVYDVIICNYANCDMVGHTGVFEAAVQAVETVDTCIGRVVKEILHLGGVAIITADHGNADQMYEPDGSPFTAHTTNPVPLLIAGHPCTLREGGRLADIAPTMLELLGLEAPPEFTGESLLAR